MVQRYYTDEGMAIRRKMNHRYPFLPSRSTVHLFLGTVANTLSLLRLFFGAGIFLGLSLSNYKGTIFSLLLLVLAALTDFLDGRVARLDRRLTTDKSIKWFGPWIDAFTDFFLFLCIYGALYSLALLPIWLLALFLLRETAMYLIIRPAAIRLGVDHSARLSGKVKTILQYSATICLVALLSIAPKIGVGLSTMRMVTIGVVTGLTAASLTSLYWYLKPIFSAWPDHQRGLPQRLCLTIIGLIFCQILFYSLLARESSFWDVFLIGTILFHMIIGGFLFWRHKDFISQNPSKPLKNMIGFPNILTLFRLGSIPTLTLILAQNLSGDTPLLILAASFAVFTTDLLDGAIARYTKKITQIGGYLDSTTDYVALTSLAILLLVHQFVPLWMFIAIILRLGLNSVATAIIILRYGIHIARPTLLGKVSLLAIAVIIILELIAYSGHFHLSPIKPILIVAEILTCLLIGLSLIDKARYFFRTLVENR